MPYTPEIDLDSFAARREMGKLVTSRDGRNLMGSLQESPLDEPYLRQEIFDDRLSQSGTTYSEHSSASNLPRGGTGRVQEIPLSSRTTPDWAQLRRDEIARAIDLQKKIVAKVTKEGTETDRILAQSKLTALESDSERINNTLNNRSTASQTYMEQGGTWSSAKKLAGSSPTSTSAMKEARWQRQEFMETTLTGTAKTFLEAAANKMGVDPSKISELRVPPPGDPPKEGEPDYAKKLQDYEKSLTAQSQYLDGRTRRFQLKIDPPASEQYGNTLTVSFLAPGSTEDTSDIDMQFIVEESPTMCSELIKTFQSTASDQLASLGLGDKSLAERFDMNPYPAGFVFRPELGSDLHFSDTYTQSSLNQKKMVDGGLALLRRLDSASDPKAEIQKMIAGLKEPERSNMLRTISVGAEVSLKAQLDRAKALQPKLTSPELSGDAFKLELATKNIGTQGQPKMWKGTDAPSIEDIAKKLEQSQQLAGLMGEIGSNSQGRKLVADARNEVYMNSLKEVEQLTVQRDEAVSELGKVILRRDEAINKLDQELSEVDKLLANNPKDQLLLEQREEILKDRAEVVKSRNANVQEMRDKTSELGVQSFTAQGVALHHADEAYTNRGAIGHVVEQQMGRKFVATSNSAISSIEANHGFILEHFEHDLQHGLDHENQHLKEGQKPLTLEDVTGEKLSKFAASVGKYAERIGQTMETVDHRSVVGVKTKEGRTEAPYQKLAQLGKDLAQIKKGVNPEDGKAITDPSLKTGLVTKALEKAGITNAQQFKDMLNNAVSHSWKTHMEQSVKGPSTSLDVTDDQLKMQRANLKPTVTDDRSAPQTNLKPTVRELMGKFGGKSQEGTAIKNGEKTGKKLREHPEMAKFMEQREQVPTEKVGKKTSVS